LEELVALTCLKIFGVGKSKKLKTAARSPAFISFQIAAKCRCLNWEATGIDGKQLPDILIYLKILRYHKHQGFLVVMRKESPGKANIIF